MSLKSIILTFLLFLLTGLLAEVFSQSRLSYKLEMHQAFQNAEGNLPSHYVTSYDSNHYVHYTDKNGVKSLVEFKADFLPTGKKLILGSYLNGSEEYSLFQLKHKNLLIQISSTYSKDQQTIYMRPVDLASQTVLPPKELTRLNGQGPYGQQTPAYFISSDSSKFSFLYRIIFFEKEISSARFGSIVFDHKINKLSDQVYNIPFDKEYNVYPEFSIMNGELINNGQMILQFTSNTKLGKELSSIFSLYSLSNGSLNTLAPHRVEKMQDVDTHLIIRDSTINIVGFYGGSKENRTYYEGTYLYELKNTEPYLVQHVMTPFSQKFYDEYRSTLKSNALRIANIYNTFIDYNLAEVVKFDDGSFLLIAEESSSGNFMFVKVSSEGKEEWAEVIQQTNSTYIDQNRLGNSRGQRFIFKRYKDKCLLIYNGYRKSFYPEQDNKYNNKSESLLLLEIDKSGQINKHVLATPEEMGKHRLWIDYSATLSDDKVLLISSDFYDSKNQQFMTLSIHEK